MLIKPRMRPFIELSILTRYHLTYLPRRASVSTVKLRLHSSFHFHFASTLLSPTQDTHSLIQYTPIEDTESIDKYRPGGYHPLQIGDRFGSHSQYRVVHILGFGGHSTTWLAWDEFQGRHVSLKIAIASDIASSQEIHTLRRLRESVCDTAGRKRFPFPIVLDSFTHNGPNGTHECLVTEPDMCSLAKSKSTSKGVWYFDLAVARTITAQLIRATVMLHSRGIVHGDIHPGNILFTLPSSFHALSTKDIYATYREPIKEPVQRRDGVSQLPTNVPPYVVPPVWLGKRYEHITTADANIMITDFGEAWFPAASPRYSLNTPVLYRPPEAVFAESEGKPISFAADIWSLGCTIYELFAPGTLFEGFFPDEDDMVAEMVSALGKPPRSWWEGWQARGDFFDAEGENWNVKKGRISDGDYYTFDARVDCIKQDRKGVVEQEELDDLRLLLGSMIRWSPEERFSADMLMVSEWMRKWGA